MATETVSNAKVNTQKQLISYEPVLTSPQMEDTHEKTTCTQKRNLKHVCGALSIFIIFTALIVWNSVLTSKLNASSKNNSSINANNTMNNTMVTSPAPTPSFCQEPDYFKSVLKEEYSQYIGGIIKNGDNEDKYEASGVTYDILRDVYWVVFDNIHSISKLTSDLTRNDDNKLVSPSTDIKINKDDDGYEGITHDAETDIFYLLTESVGFDVNDEEMYHPMIRSVVYDETSSFTQTQICVVNMSVPTDNKGFEGLDLIIIDGKKYFVALCEGNFCSFSDEGRDVGHGRMVLIEFSSTDISSDYRYQYLIDELIDCVYNVINKFELPSYIAFEDYSDFQFMIDNSSSVDNVYDLAIVSQSSSALWIGQVEWSLDNGPVFDADYEEEIYPFPYGGDCEVIFCNVEGVTFVNQYEFVMVSDSAKRKGDQPWVCGQKEQSVHILKLP